MRTIKKGDTRNLPVLVSTIFLFLIISPIIGSADINLTVVSSNNKTISISNLETNSVIGTLNQSETISVPYTNIFIKVNTANTMTLPTLKIALLSGKQADIIMIFILVLLLAFGYALLKM